MKRAPPKLTAAGDCLWAFGCSQVVDVDRDLERPDAGRAAPECVPGLCRACDANGVAVVPASDPRCPPLDCSRLGFGHVDLAGRTATCTVTPLAPAADRACADLDTCATPETSEAFCVPLPQVTSAPIDTACAGFVDCEHADSRTAPFASGVLCATSDDAALGYCDGDGRCAACVPAPDGLEVCNGLDDDCDGRSDEDEVRQRRAPNIVRCCNPPPDRGGDPNQEVSYWCCSTAFGGSERGGPGDCCEYPPESEFESYVFTCAAP